MADKIVIATGPDWQGIYVNDVLKIQGHHLEAGDALRAVGVEYEAVDLDDEWMFKVGQLPDDLKELKVQDNG